MIINLDTLNAEKETIKVNDTKHEVKDFTVNDFTKYLKREEKGEFKTRLEQTKALAKIICPTVNIDELTTTQETVLYEFFITKLNGEVDEKKKNEVLKPQN